MEGLLRGRGNAVSDADAGAVHLTQAMYDGVTTLVKTKWGHTREFPLNIGLPQESALSPCLFADVLDVLSGNIRRQMPWNTLLASDLVICAEGCETLQGNF